MAVQRMEHVGVVVDDLAAATAFFVELGLELRAEWEAEGDWVDRTIGLAGVRTAVAMVAAPNGSGAIELVEFRAPPAEGDDPAAPSNARGIRHLSFAVDDLDATLERLADHGAELVGEIVDYEDIWRVCYLRGPEGILVELGEKLS